MKRILLCMFAILAAVSSYAEGYFVTIDGLKFMADTHAKTATLMANSYSGDITVPASFTDKGVEYRVTSLNESCFEGCSNLTSVTLPSTITSLSDRCFYNCYNLKKVNIPSSVTSIGTECFGICQALTSIDIPSSVTSLGNFAFAHCSSLTSIVIPSSVTTLGNCCFASCTGLTNFTIPQSITSIGIWCFEDCNNLTSMVCLAKTPPSASNGSATAFDSFNTANCMLNVPDVDAYKSADGWKNFKYIFKFLLVLY